MRTESLFRPTDTLADLARSAPIYETWTKGLVDELRQLVPNSDAYLDDEAAAAALTRVIDRFMARGWEEILSLQGLPWPRYPVDTGGSQDVPAPREEAATVPVSQTGWSVLGFDVGFPIGIPACELTSTPDWIEYYARQGFHVLTFQTVRSRERRAAGDWAFVDVDRPWEPGYQPKTVRRTDGSLPRDWRAISTATPFAAPSPRPEVWRKQIAESRKRLDRLGGGHVLIVSVTDSVKPKDKSDETLAADFAKVAGWAEAEGAQAIECYLARSRRKDPASGKLQPCQYGAETSEAIVSAVRAELAPATKIVIKLGDMSSDDLEAIVVPLVSKGYVDGVSGISPVRINVTPPGRVARSGNQMPAVAGVAIRNLGMNFVKRLASIRRRHQLDFDIIGMGGVMTPDDVATYRRLGAAAVQTASAARCKPGLAAAAYALDRRVVPESVEDWEGVVDMVDGNTFLARLSDVAGELPDEEAEFDLGEVSPDDRSKVEPGAVFRWQSNLTKAPNGFVSHSFIRFKTLPSPSKEDIRAGKRFVERARQAFVEPEPGTPLG